MSGFSVAAPVRNIASHTLATWTQITATTPIDDTIPQVGEGAEILTATLTPTSTTSKVRARVTVPGSVNAAGRNLILALFINGASNAVKSMVVTGPATDYVFQMTFEYEHTPGTLSAQTYSVRAGVNTGTGGVCGNSAGRLLGGVLTSTLTVEELLQ